ncbi:MAG: peptidoglycan-binding protein, partial [Candidatus Dormibacteraeota bacterium]|nr:peptidoglycan-binding protein [Candidatus Dormibacteraeota bacterium]
VPVATARVVRADVSRRESLNGTITFGPTMTVFAAAGSPPAAVGEARSGADEAAAQLQAARDQLGAAQQHGDTTTVAAARHSVAAASTKLADAQQALAQVLVTATLAPGLITWLPVPGTVVDRGHVLYRVGATPIVLLFGDVPAWRRLGVGVSGPDVQQLEQNLLALGFGDGSDLVADGDFTAADAAAVERWQAALALPQTGTIDLGQVVFQPGPVRVTTLHAAVGSMPQGGSSVLDLSPTRRYVEVDLDTALLGFVHPNDAVSITLPDGTTATPGRIVSVGAVATVAASQQGAPPPRPTVPVTVDVADQHALAGYDQAPIRVLVTDTVHRGVLAVPVTALLAEGDSAYAVRLVQGDQRRLVAVVPGLFSDSGIVEITGPGLRAGDIVEVPRL